LRQQLKNPKQRIAWGSFFLGPSPRGIVAL
jgi:hypothetical protein